MGQRAIGISKESTYDTFAPPQVWLEVLSEGIQREPDLIPVETIRSIITRDLSLGGAPIRGPFQAQGNYQDLAHLFYYWFGDVTTTGAGPYVHTSPATTTPVLTRPPLSFEVKRDPDLFASGEGDTWRYTGCLLTELSLAMAIGQLFTVSGQIIGSSETRTGTTGTSESYGDLDLIVPTVIGVSFDATALDVESCNLTIRWPADEPRKLGSTGFARQPRDAGVLEITGEIVLLNHEDAQYDKFVANSAVDVEITAPSGAGEDLTINLDNCRIAQGTPHLDGRNTPKPTYRIQALYDATVESGMQTVVTNDVAAVPA